MGGAQEYRALFLAFSKDRHLPALGAARQSRASGGRPNDEQLVYDRPDPLVLRDDQNAWALFPETLGPLKKRAEMMRHRSRIVRDQKAPLALRDGQNVWVRQTFQPCRMGRLNIHGGFFASEDAEDGLIEVGIGLKADLHGEPFSKGNLQD